MAEMTEQGYREQAIKDVAEACDRSITCVENIAEGYGSPYEKAITLFSIEQQARVLRLEYENSQLRDKVAYLQKRDDYVTGCLV